MTRIGALLELHWWFNLHTPFLYLLFVIQWSTIVYFVLEILYIYLCIAILLCILCYYTIITYNSQYMKLKYIYHNNGICVYWNVYFRRPLYLILLIIIICRLIACCQNGRREFTCFTNIELDPWIIYNILGMDGWYSLNSVLHLHFLYIRFNTFLHPLPIYSLNSFFTPPPPIYLMTSVLPPPPPIYI